MDRGRGPALRCAVEEFSRTSSPWTSGRWRTATLTSRPCIATGTFLPRVIPDLGLKALLRDVLSRLEGGRESRREAYHPLWRWQIAYFGLALPCRYHRAAADVIPKARICRARQSASGCVRWAVLRCGKGQGNAGHRRIRPHSLGWIAWRLCGKKAMNSCASRIRLAWRQETMKP